MKSVIFMLLCYAVVMAGDGIIDTTAHYKIFNFLPRTTGVHKSREIQMFDFEKKVNTFLSNVIVLDVKIDNKSTHTNHWFDGVKEHINISYIVKYKKDDMEHEANRPLWQEGATK